MKKALIVFYICAVLSVWSGAPADANNLEVEYENIGILTLEIAEGGDFESSQLILTRPGGMRSVIDSYEGLLPADLKKLDINCNGNFELLALLTHPNGQDVIPYIYDADFTRIFPQEAEAVNPIICREIFMTSIEEEPALCARYPVSYHNFGPPYLYRLEYYKLEAGRLRLYKTGFSEGDHFNILMNRGAYEFNQGRYLESLKYYGMVIASSTGEIGTEPFVETLFFLAESRRFSKDFDGAKKLYEKIVLEFPHNFRTDASQGHLELISLCENHLNHLSLLIDITYNIRQGEHETALALLNDQDLTETSPIADVFLFTKAEALTASNRLEEAISIYYEILRKFPQSHLTDTVVYTLESIEDTDEETDGI